MYLLGVLCLLSAAVALPTPEQLHTNLPALPPPPERKPENGDEMEQVIVDPPGPIPEEIAIEEPDKSDESKNVLESAEKSKKDNDKAQDKPDDKEVIQKDAKESKEFKESKEKSKESKESKELNDQTEIRSEEPQKEKKEKDSKSEESKERFDEDVPVVVQVIKGPKDYLSDWFTNIWEMWQNINWPTRRSEFPNGDQPIYIVKESDLDFD